MRSLFKRITYVFGAAALLFTAVLITDLEAEAAPSPVTKTTTMECSVWSAPDTTSEANRVKRIPAGYSVTVYPEVVQSTAGDGKTFYMTVKGNYILCKCFEETAAADSNYFVVGSWDENGVYYETIVDATIGERDDMEQEIFALLNQARVENGLSPLVWDDSMAQLADTRAYEIGTMSLSHIRPDGTKVSETYGYGENLTAFEPSAYEAHRQWMASSGHRANILRDGITKGAVGVYCNGYFLCFVELFSY